MFKQIYKYVHSCESCQRYKVNQQTPAGMMLTRLPEEPWCTVTANFIGPHPRSTTGHNMALVLVDKYTKWTDIVPLRQATTPTWIKAFRQRILAWFGTPKTVITGNNS